MKSPLNSRWREHLLAISLILESMSEIFLHQQNQCQQGENLGSSSLLSVITCAFDLCRHPSSLMRNRRTDLIQTSQHILMNSFSFRKGQTYFSFVFPHLSSSSLALSLIKRVLFCTYYVVRSFVYTHLYEPYR